MSASALITRRFSLGRSSHYHTQIQTRYNSNYNNRKLAKPNPVPVPDNQLLTEAKSRPQLLRTFLEPVSPIQEDDPYDFEGKVSIERLFKERVHFGHKMGTLKENMKWALYGERLGVCIFDLDITRKYMIRALNFIAALSYCGGRFLFITTNRSSILLVEDMVKELGEYAHTRPWNQEIFTNRRFVAGGPIRFPDAMIFLNTHTSTMERHPGIVEAAKMCIPTVAIVDSNCDPNYISYPIPGNDDTFDSIKYYMEMFKKAIECGRTDREDAKEMLETDDQQKRMRKQRRQTQPRLRIRMAEEEERVQQPQNPKLAWDRPPPPPKEEKEAEPNGMGGANYGQRPRRGGGGGGWNRGK